MYSGNETVNAIRKLNSRGYAILVEDLSGGQVVSIFEKGKQIKKFRDDRYGESSDSIPIYGTALKNMIDWMYNDDPSIV